MRLIWGYEAIKETNFTHVFLFLIYDVYVITVSSLIKIKLFLCSAKFYDFLLSLMAVFKKPPHHRRLSPTYLDLIEEATRKYKLTL